MKKILILGASGTGKTTLCRKVANKVSAKALHMDSIYWVEDWNHVSKDELNSIIKKFIKKNRSWVIDGNYSRTKSFKTRLSACDTIIYLDYGRRISINGIREREKKYKKRVRSDMAKGCLEEIDSEFLTYVWNYHKSRNKIVKATVLKYRFKKKLLIFKTREETDKWVNSL